MSDKIRIGLIGAGMNWSQAVLTILAANAIVLIPMVLVGHAGADRLRGNQGFDRAYGGPGNDALDGQESADDEGRSPTIASSASRIRSRPKSNSARKS